MNAEYLYTVAGHTFSLVMNSAHPCRGLMFNYLPFAAVSRQTGIFTLTLCDHVSLADAIPVVVNHDKYSGCCRLNIYRTSDSYLFALYVTSDERPHGILRIHHHFRQAELTLCGSVQECYAALDRSLLLCYLLATAARDTLLIHASAVVKDGYAYLFLGKSGTGKSTQRSLDALYR